MDYFKIAQTVEEIANNQTFPNQELDPESERQNKKHIS